MKIHFLWNISEHFTLVAMQQSGRLLCDYLHIHLSYAGCTEVAVSPKEEA